MGVKKRYCFICLSVCCVVSFTYISGPSDFLLGFYNIDYFAIVHNLPLAFRAERILLTSTTASVLCHAIIAVSDFLEFLVHSHTSQSRSDLYHAVSLRTNKVFFNL